MRAVDGSRNIQALLYRPPKRIVVLFELNIHRTPW